MTNKKLLVKNFEALFNALDVEGLQTLSEKTSIRIAHDLQYEERTWDEDRAIVEAHIGDFLEEAVGNILSAVEEA